MRDEIQTKRQELFQLKTRFDRMEKKLNRFYADYIEAMGEPLSQLLEIEELLKIQQQSLSTGTAKKAPSADAKQLYRKLVKSVHPDVSHQDPDSAEAFRLIQTLYENADIATLELINGAMQDAPEMGEAEILEALTSQCGKYHKRLQEQQVSEVYQLYTQFEEARFEGWDYFAELINALHAEIAEKQAALIQLSRRQKEPVASALT